MTLYQDQIQKIKYYRSRIIQEFTRKGIYPDDTKIVEKLNNIDTMLGIFQYTDVATGSLFNATKFNEDIIRILTDLKILYQLSYQMSIKEYEELQGYCEAHISELQHMADNYRYKTQLELGSTYLGETVFYQGTAYDMSLSNGVITVKLGSVEVEAQAKLACVFNSNSVKLDTVIFSFNDGKGDILKCSAYGYNRDFLVVPGTLEKKIAYITIQNENVRTAFICTPASLEGTLSHDNKYILYGGKGHIARGYFTKTIEEKTSGIPIELSNGGCISFFVVNATYINFEFSTIPDNKNFQGTNILNPSYCQKVYIEHSSMLSFDFVTDGILFATRQQGVILDNQLIYPVADPVPDLTVEVYSTGSKKTYDVTVTAEPYNSAITPVIEAIAIKQISSFENI